MCKTITVDGEQKGVRGGKCGKPTSNNLSFSITKSVATKHSVDVTSPHIARRCSLSANVTATLLPTIGRMDSAIRDNRGGVCVWEAEGWADHMWAGASPSSPRLYLSHHAPHVAATHRGLPGAGTWTDGRAGDPVSGGARWSPAFDCTRRRPCCSTMNSSTL